MPRRNVKSMTFDDLDPTGMLYDPIAGRYIAVEDLPFEASSAGSVWLCCDAVFWPGIALTREGVGSFHPERIEAALKDEIGEASVRLLARFPDLIGALTSCINARHPHLSKAEFDALPVEERLQTFSNEWLTKFIGAWNEEQSIVTWRPNPSLVFSPRNEAVGQSLIP